MVIGLIVVAMVVIFIAVAVRINQLEAKYEELKQKYTQLQKTSSEIEDRLTILTTLNLPNIATRLDIVEEILRKSGPESVEIQEDGTEYHTPMISDMKKKAGVISQKGIISAKEVKEIGGTYTYPAEDLKP